MKLQLSQARHRLRELVSHRPLLSNLLCKMPLPPSPVFTPPFFPSPLLLSILPSLPPSEHSTLTSSWVAEFPASPHGMLFPQTFQRAKNDHSVGGDFGEKGSMVSPSRWSSPLRQPIATSNSKYLKVSCHPPLPLSSHLGMALLSAPGALPDPGTCAPHSLATFPHPYNCGTNHLPSSLIAAGGAQPGAPLDRTVPLHTALTPPFLSVRPLTCLCCLRREPRLWSSARRGGVRAPAPCLSVWHRAAHCPRRPTGLLPQVLCFLAPKGPECRPESSVPKAHASRLP